MRKVVCLVFVLCMILCFSACNSDNTDNTTPTETTSSTEATTLPDHEKVVEFHEFYSIKSNANLTYSYEIVDKNGKVLFSKDNAVKPPNIEQLTETVYSVTMQTGTGLSTNWAIFCDVENSCISETFYYVLGTQGEYVFYADYSDGIHTLIVQNIFDKNVYCKTYTLQNCGVFADPILQLIFEDEGIATVKYLTGTENAISETSATIYFP